MRRGEVIHGNYLRTSILESLQTLTWHEPADVLPRCWDEAMSLSFWKCWFLNLKRSALKYHLRRSFQCSSRTRFHAQWCTQWQTPNCRGVSKHHHLRQVTTARTIISGDTTQTLSGETASPCCGNKIFAGKPWERMESCRNSDLSQPEWRKALQPRPVWGIVLATRKGMWIEHNSASVKPRDTGTLYRTRIHYVKLMLHCMKNDEPCFLFKGHRKTVIFWRDSGQVHAAISRILRCKYVYNILYRCMFQYCYSWILCICIYELSMTLMYTQLHSIRTA